MSPIHPHTKALAELLAAVAPFTPRHSGACIDFKQKHWPVSDASCKCNQEHKRIHHAIRDARASLDYDTPPATNEERHNWRISSVCRQLHAERNELRNALACLICSGPAHPNEINLSPAKTEQYFADVKRAQNLVLASPS